MEVGFSPPGAAPTQADPPPDELQRVSPMSACGQALELSGGALPWILSLHESLGLLHSKTDQAHQQVAQMNRDLYATQNRVRVLEDVASHHTAAQSSTNARLEALERGMQSLREQGHSRAASRGRSPTPSHGGGGRDVSPGARRSPRSRLSDRCRQGSCKPSRTWQNCGALDKGL